MRAISKMPEIWVCIRVERGTQETQVTQSLQSTQ